MVKLLVMESPGRDGTLLRRVTGRLGKWHGYMDPQVLRHHERKTLRGTDDVTGKVKSRHPQPSSPVGG